MRFQDIPGLESTKAKLIDAVANNHVAHAQLFVGMEGSANLAMALAFSSYLNCENPTDTDACGECPSCQKNAKFIHPDVNFIFPSAATPKLKREDATSEKFLTEWRTFLEQSVYGNVKDWSSHFGWENKLLMIPRQESRNIVKALSLKAFEGQYKIMIVWLPELMNGNAANGILKILEEPPEKTIFLMVSSEANKLLTTITSRTQQLRIPSFSDEDVSNTIVPHGITPERADRIAYMSEGNMRLALQMVGGEDNETQEYFKNWFRQCFTFNFQELTKMADEFQKKGKEFQKELLGVGTKVMRESLINSVSLDSLSRIPDQEKGFIEKFSSVFTAEKIMKVTPKLDEAQYHIERNANPKILFLDLSMTIGQIARS
ncbi:DNA polymerase III subunit [Roseivirga misakiensis]|uniref:DNA polymerase III subunit delta n=1 Tax=Roseivirga misakiensis TaxID=1563681 RepID=A0A1E5T5J0_9BACT|nr:DNA polymerase III subunit delta [Roseivirga misakiensis]OEK06639.1 DNA polymerase III subunit delta [Roseivirga misakiensis]